VSGVTIGSYTG